MLFPGMGAVIGAALAVMVGSQFGPSLDRRRSVYQDQVAVARRDPQRAGAAKDEDDAPPQAQLQVCRGTLTTWLAGMG